jgi:hypothetical protein
VAENNYPMPRVHCGARTRAGGACRQPAMPNGKCRLHGGKSKAGKAHGRYVCGMYTKEAIEHRRRTREILRRAKLTLTGRVAELLARFP